MSENTLKQAVLELAEPAVEAQGLAIWGLKITESGRMTIRLFVDMPEETEQPAEPGISDNEETDTDFTRISATVDQCEQISRQLALALDAEELIDRAYTLEVSSPGFNRLFFSAEQMLPYIGDMVEARMQRAFSPSEDISPRRIWKGVLEEVHDQNITIAPASVDSDGDVLKESVLPVTLPFQAIRRASRIHIFSKPQKPGKGNKPGKAKKNDPKSKR